MTSPTSAPTTSELAELKERYQLLGAAEHLAVERFSKALQAGDLKGARELHARLEAALVTFRKEALKTFTTLEDGRVLLTSEFEGLSIFAESNHIDLRVVLKEVELQYGSVRKANFKIMGLTTLEGLSSLTTIEELNISRNSLLKSLSGAPTKALKRLYADGCGLQGDLSAISSAQNLLWLNVNSNWSITSLKGIPTTSLETLLAASCNLTGDLTELQLAVRLCKLDVSNNIRLTSLSGIPPQEIQHLNANNCGLSGNLSTLQQVGKLEWLRVSGNPFLTSLQGLPIANLKSLIADRCGLEGDLGLLEEARQLVSLIIFDNPNLERKAVQRVINKLSSVHALRAVSI